MYYFWETNFAIIFSVILFDTYFIVFIPFLIYSYCSDLNILFTNPCYVSETKTELARCKLFYITARTYRVSN